MGEVLKKALHKNTAFWVLTIFSILLVSASFVCPPMGVIDSSVIAVFGELLGLGALWTVVKAIDNGTDAKVSHNGTEITINNPEKEN